MAQEPALAFDAATVASEGTVGADHAVARNNDPNGIGTIGQADGSDGVWAADALREGSVRDSGAAGYLPQGTPDFALKGCASSLHGQRVNRGQVASKIADDCRGETAGILGRLDCESIYAVVKLQGGAQVRVVV